MTVHLHYGGASIVSSTSLVHLGTFYRGSDTLNYYDTTTFYDEFFQLSYFIMNISVFIHRRRWTPENRINKLGEYPERDIDIGETKLVAQSVVNSFSTCGVLRVNGASDLAPLTAR